MYNIYWIYLQAIFTIIITDFILHRWKLTKITFPCYFFLYSIVSLFHCYTFPRMILLMLYHIVIFTTLITMWTIYSTVLL